MICSWVWILYFISKEKESLLFLSILLKSSVFFTLSQNAHHFYVFEEPIFSSKMVRRDECEFSHFVIHPGHGRRYVPFAFISTKPVLSFARPQCFALYQRKKNPRFVPWTRTYRRLHKKHQDDAKTKRRRTKVSRAPRAIVGLDLPTLQETRAKNKKVDRSAKGAAVRAEVAARKAAKK